MALITTTIPKRCWLASIARLKIKEEYYKNSIFPFQKGEKTVVGSPLVEFTEHTTEK